MPRELSRNTGAKILDEANRVLETSSTSITRYDKANIGKLSKAKVREVQELYLESYRRSVWSTVKEEDPKEIQRLRGWYNSDEGRAWIERCSRLNPFLEGFINRGVVLNPKATTELLEWYDTKEGMGWFRDALKFYLDQAKAGKGQLLVATDRESGRIIASFFVLTANGFLENASEEKAAELRKVMDQIGASADNTLYVGEIFVSDKIRGLRGGMVISSMDRLAIDYAIGNGYEHLVAWTLDRDDNSMLNTAGKLGFSRVPDSQADKGADISRMEDGRLGFVAVGNGPIVYLSVNIEDAAKASALVSNRRFALL